MAETIQEIKWIDARYKLPETDDNVIINYRSIARRQDAVDNVTIGCYIHKIESWCRHDGPLLDYVTHWTILPSIPK